MSFFEAIFRFVDYQFRQRTNSLNEFLQSIDIDEEVFTERRLTIMGFSDSSIRLKDFQEKYSKFCLQNGLKL